MGAGLGLACAVHCLLAPVVLGILPLFGLGFLATEAAETWFVCAVLVVAVASALWGFRRHRALRVTMSFFAAAGVLLLGRWLGEDHPLGWPLTIGGAVAITATHFISARLCGRCPEDATAPVDDHRHA